MNRSVKIYGVVFALLAALVSTAFAGPFGAGNLVVSRIGDGGGALAGGAANRTFLDEFTTGGAPVQAINMPSPGSGSNRAFVNSGSATSEGVLTRSVDGRYLTLAGYDAAPGTAGIATAANINRVIGRVDSQGNVDTSTSFIDGYTLNNIRGAVSIDGSRFWASGTGGGGGTRVIDFGASTSTQLSTSVTNTRVVNIFNNQLYTSSASGAFQGVSTVGTGVPITSGQTTTLLPGFPTASGPSSYDYFFSDASTIFVADDRASVSGGLQKWTFNGATWLLQYTLNSGLTANIGLRGLTGIIEPTGAARLYAISADAVNNKLVTIVDTGAASAFSTLATAGTNMIFRGVDFSPVPEPGTLALLAIGGAALLRRFRR